MNDYIPYKSMDVIRHPRPNIGYKSTRTVCIYTIGKTCICGHVTPEVTIEFITSRDLGVPYLIITVMLG